MDSWNCRFELDIMVYEKIRRRQSRNDLLHSGLLILLVALLCIFVIAMWIVGFRTPQNASFKEWFALVSAVVILGLIIFVVLLLVNNLLRDKDARKRFVEGFKQREFGFRG